jgi:hypothetical protein
MDDKWRLLWIDFVVGLGVVTNPLCNSVSFRGGGARTVLTTCYPDSSGDFSKLSAVAGSWLIGLAIFGILFWPTLKVLFSNYQFRQKLSQATQEYNNQQVLPEGVNKAQDETSNQTHPQFANLTKTISDNKLIAGVLVVVLLLGFYKVAAPKISLLNPITCSSLKKELAAKDVIGRQIWNEYQTEVSRLGQTEEYGNTQLWVNQVGNVSRRATQLMSNYLAGFEMMLEKEHCVKVDYVKAAKVITQSNLDFIAGRVLQNNGNYWSPEWGWDSRIHSQYLEFKEGLR